MAREERFEIYASEGVGGGVEDLSRGKWGSAKGDSGDKAEEESNLAGYVEGAEKDDAAGEGGGHGIVGGWVG